jgi:replicative DNA helicase
MAEQLRERPPKRAANQDAQDRQVPWDKDAEQGVIGSVVIDPRQVDEVALRVASTHFHDPAHETIFRHVMALRNANKPVDPTLLVASLKAADEFETIGGMAYLSQVINAVPNAAHAIHYADIVRDHAIRRTLIHQSSVALQDAYDTGTTIAEVIARTEAAVFSVADKLTDRSQAADLNQAIFAALESIDKRKSGELRGVPTGITELDGKTGGMNPGEVTVLAGRTSMGKTAFAMNIALAVARSESPVLIFSLEMDAQSLAERLLSQISRVDFWKMRSGHLSPGERRSLTDAAGELGALPLRIDDVATRTVTELASVCRRQKRKPEGLGLVIIDYLQLLAPDNPKEPRQEQVAKMSRAIKNLAREMKVPVLCLAQLNRQTANSDKNRPALSHLRESGAIEQDADVVLFTHRPWYFTGQRPERGQGEPAVIVVGKQRQGPLGDVEVLWFGQWMSFTNKASATFEERGNYEPDFDSFNTRQSA